MTHKHTKTPVHRSVGTINRVETNGQTTGTDCFAAVPSRLTRPVTNRSSVYSLSGKLRDLVDVDGFGEHGSESLTPSDLPVALLVGGGRRLRLRHVDVAAAAPAASTSQEQHGTAGRAAAPRRPRAVAGSRRLLRAGRRPLLAAGIVARHRAEQAAEAAEDVLVEEAEGGRHDEAEVGQRVQRQRNADDGVQHRRQPTAGRTRRYVTVTCAIYNTPQFVRKYPYIHGYFLANFPYFNETGSVYLCRPIRKSTE